MSIGIYLIDHPPATPQYRSPRREAPSGLVVVHTAESHPDEVGPDTGAENVAAFIAERTNPGSYHDLADSDSIVQLVRYSDEAFGDATGSNRYAYHVSAATQAAKWASLGQRWAERCVVNMAAATARYARWVRAYHGVAIPARRVSRAQSEAREPGFISHAERDPDRRTDPGRGFDWPLFLDTYEQIMEGTEMELSDTVRLFTGQGVDYSQATTDVEHVLASTNLVAFQTRNRVAAMAARLGALEAVLAAHVADVNGGLTAEQVTAAARAGAETALAQGVDLRVSVGSTEAG